MSYTLKLTCTRHHPIRSSIARAIPIPPIVHPQKVNGARARGSSIFISLHFLSAKITKLHFYWARTSLPERIAKRVADAQTASSAPHRNIRINICVYIYLVYDPFCSATPHFSAIPRRAATSVRASVLFQDLTARLLRSSVLLLDSRVSRLLAALHAVDAVELLSASHHAAALAALYAALLNSWYKKSNVQRAACRVAAA